jgi:CBS domain-containing protein
MLSGYPLPKAKVADIMTTADITIEAGRTVREAAIQMDRTGCGCLIVLQEGRVVGIVTEKDLVRRALSLNTDPAKVKISEIMSYPVIAVSPETHADEALKIMASNGLRRLPVIHNDRLEGVVTIDRLAYALAAQQQAMEEWLKLILEVSKPPESSYIG